MVRHCDAQTHRQFQFLCVDGPASYNRMQQFLNQQGLSVSGVRMPFVILVHQDESQRVFSRSVLHGAPLQQWLAEMVDALMETPGMSPVRMKQMFLEPYISPHILRLAERAVGPVVAAEPFVPIPKPPPAYVKHAGLQQIGMHRKRCRKRSTPSPPRTMKRC